MTGSLVTVKELAPLLKTSEREIYRLALRGDIRGYRIGRQWRFLPEEVLEDLRAERNGRSP